MTPDRIYTSVALLCTTLLCMIAAGDSTGEFVGGKVARWEEKTSRQIDLSYLLSADVSQPVARNLALP